jgi:hypothetical protein
MSARLASAVVRAGTALMPDPAVRARYREQWLADVDGAADLGLSPLPVALGAAAAAIRLATADRRSLAALPQIDARPRRALGVVQLAVAAPYLWAVAFYGYARLRLGASHAELMGAPHDPKDLLVSWFPPFWLYTPAVLWIAVGGWVVAAVLAPAGLLLGLGGRGAARWLPLAGTVAALAATALAASTFGDELRTWLLD